ncbi:MAG: hypothetical protein ACYTG0_12860, partial [Planctomycetota bacterium]
MRAQKTGATTGNGSAVVRNLGFRPVTGLRLVPADEILDRPGQAAELVGGRLRSPTRNMRGRTMTGRVGRAESAPF